LLRTSLNLGILAHVDAGKTTLSERLLYEAGVIGEIGRVDDGTTQTDSLALERQRGITIRSAVVSLPIRGMSVNLIDTPGHPDFIAEVDRVLAVLDGAVLVISAVEGVQPQTRVLLRALRRLSVPTLLFINKIDRRGADIDRTLTQIARRLSVTAVPMVRAERVGQRDARVTACTTADATFRGNVIETLADRDDAILATYVDHEATLTSTRLWAELADQTRRSMLHPVYAGSAVTGAGVGPLVDGIVEFLPAVAGDPDGPAAGRIFKIERSAAGQKVAYIRMSAGSVHLRDPLGGLDKVSGITVFQDGAWVRRDRVCAGEIGKLSGLSQAKVGDAIGPGSDDASRLFAPPTLEAVVVPVRYADHVALRSALTQLTDQDPLINVRFDDARHELAVSLYGEVQKEVIQATLAADFGIEVSFRETTTLYIERPTGTGDAIEKLNAPGNPFHATIGLRVEPGAPGSGVEFRLAVDFRTMPLFVFRNVDEFAAAMTRYVRESLREGRFGWPVDDCVVTMTDSNYSTNDGPPSERGPTSTAADFRKLTPLVLTRALDRAGTVVCQPMSRVIVDSPATTLGPVLSTLASLGAAVERQSIRGDEVTVAAVLPATEVPTLHHRLPAATNGEGVVEAGFGGYEPVRGEPPRRRRTTADPRNRQQYLASAGGHGGR
jgi:ribosomal protection tetracycline resistance protein